MRDCPVFTLKAPSLKNLRFVSYHGFFTIVLLRSMQLQTERDWNTNRFIYQEETLNMLPPTPPPTLHYADHNGNLSRWQLGPDDWHQHLPLLEAGCGEVEAGLLWPLLHLLWSRVSRGQSGDNLINCTWAPLPLPLPPLPSPRPLVPRPYTRDPQYWHWYFWKTTNYCVPFPIHCVQTSDGGGNL